MQFDVTKSAGPEKLTNREREVLEYLVCGYTRQEIPSKMGITEKTVDSHRRSLLIKLNLGSNMELAHYALYHSLCPIKVKETAKSEQIDTEKRFQWRRWSALG